MNPTLQSHSIPFSIQLSLEKLTLKGSPGHCPDGLVSQGWRGYPLCRGKRGQLV